MRPTIRSSILASVAVITFLFLIRTSGFTRSVTPQPKLQIYRLPMRVTPDYFAWETRQDDYPVKEYTPIPEAQSHSLPRVQHVFGSETKEQESVRLGRQAKVKSQIRQCWRSYIGRAREHDENRHHSLGERNPLGLSSAGIVDTLDILWIADLKEEFWEVLDEARRVDFLRIPQQWESTINVFEISIRYLGGFLAAYELSGHMDLLNKALEVAHMLYAAFDTPNRLPIIRWHSKNAAQPGAKQQAPDSVLLAEIGSLTLEFTRLSQITNDPKWYDAVSRIMTILDEQQDKTILPGMWPSTVNARNGDFISGSLFTLGATSDSVYEYLPKMYALLGGSELYDRLWDAASTTIVKYALYKPMTPENAKIMMAGSVTTDDGTITIQSEVQHRMCFSGGMFALAGRLMEAEELVGLGRRLTDGCTWAYDNSVLGISPEIYTVVPCKYEAFCRWNQTLWYEEVRERYKKDPRDVQTIIRDERLQPGLTSVPNRGYILGSETIESLFVLYRITGDRSIQDIAWRIFSNITKHTRSRYHTNVAIDDVTDPSAPKGGKENARFITETEEKAYWITETLKYLYLIFSEPSLISLDEFVFNTGAHPLRRATPGGAGGICASQDTSNSTWYWRCSTVDPKLDKKYSAWAAESSRRESEAFPN